MCCTATWTASNGCALGVRMGDEFILTEWLTDERLARERAAELRRDFLTRGWCELH